MSPSVRILASDVLQIAASLKPVDHKILSAGRTEVIALPSAPGDDLSGVANPIHAS